MVLCAHFDNIDYCLGIDDQTRLPDAYKARGRVRSQIHPVPSAMPKTNRVQKHVTRACDFDNYFCNKLVAPSVRFITINNLSVTLTHTAALSRYQLCA